MITRGVARVGMAGWVFPDWRGTFYPKGLPQKGELAYASTHVTSIEFNGSFYALHKPTSWRAWRDGTPDDFVFSVKAPRLITHMRKLRGVEEPVANFFASGILALGAKLGPIMWQLPAGLVYDLQLLEDFLNLLPRTTVDAVEVARGRGDRMTGREHLATDAERPVRHAIEVRDHSFAVPGFAEQLRRHGVAAVLGESAGKWPLIDEATADFRYARLHADEAMRPGGYYDDAALDEWAVRVDGWLDGGSDAFVYFDNYTKVRAPIDALGLISRLRES